MYEKVYEKFTRNVKSTTSTTVCLINDAAYYTDINLNSYNRGSEQIIQRKVYFLYAKNQPDEFPGYGLVH